jgi:hypothetical protein
VDDHPRAVPFVLRQPGQGVLEDGQVRRVVAGELGRPQERHLGPERAGDVRDLLVVGADDEAVQIARRARCLDAPGDQRLPAEQLQILARHRLGAAPRRNDPERRQAMSHESPAWSSHVPVAASVTPPNGFKR